MRDRVIAVGAGAIALVGAVALPWVRFGDRVNLGDTRHYREIAERILDGSIPYHQFFVEYPPGALPIFLLPTIGTSSAPSYTIFFRAAAAVVTLITIALVVRTVEVLGADLWRMIAAAVFVGISPALLGSVYLARYDVWAAALTSVALFLMVRGHARTSALLLGIGAAIKVYPALLIPLLLIEVGRRLGRGAAIRCAAISACAFALIVGPFAPTGAGGVGFSFKTQLTRVLEIESLGGAGLLAAHKLGLYHPTVYAGLSYELIGHAPDAAGVLMSLLLAAGLAASYWACWASERKPEDLVLSAAAVLAVTVAFDKVLSPQYLVWLIPVVALLWGRVGAVAWGLLAAAMILTASYFPSHFRDLRTGGGTAWVVLGRDALLVTLAVFLVTVAVRGRSPVARSARTLRARRRRRGLTPASPAGS